MTTHVTMSRVAIVASLVILVGFIAFKSLEPTILDLPAACLESDNANVTCDSVTASIAVRACIVAACYGRESRLHGKLCDIMKPSWWLRTTNRTKFLSARLSVR